MKGNEEVLWCRVNGINVGVQEMERVREGVPILLSDAVINFVWWCGKAPMEERVNKLRE